MQERFQLFKVRPFTEVINDSISFGRRYTRQIGYAILVMVIPVYLIGSFFYASGLSSVMDLKRLSTNMINWRGIAAGSVLGLLAMMIGGGLLRLIFMSAFIQVENSDTGEIAADDIFDGVKKYLGRLLGFYFLLFLMAAGVGAIVALLIAALVSISATFLIVLLGFALFAGLIYLVISMTFAPIIYIREGLGFGPSIARSFHLVKNNWWLTLAVLMVGGFIGGMAGYIFQIPFLVLTMIKTFANIRGGHMGYNLSLADKLALTLSNFGGIIAAIVMAIVNYIQYYSLIEKKDGISLMEQIQDIGADETLPN